MIAGLPAEEIKTEIRILVSSTTRIRLYRPFLVRRCARTSRTASSTMRCTPLGCYWHCGILCPGRTMKYPPPNGIFDELGEVAFFHTLTPKKVRKGRSVSFETLIFQRTACSCI